DADVSDSHTFSVSAAAAHGQASVDADGTWHYTVARSDERREVAAGEHLADSFTGKHDDGHGGVVEQVVNLTITGTNDTPVITSGVQAGSVFEGDGGSSLAAQGQISFTDADLSDSHTFSVSAAAAHAQASVDADGTWHYTVA